MLGCLQFIQFLLVCTHMPMYYPAQHNLQTLNPKPNKERTIQMVKAGKQEEDLMSIKIYQATYSWHQGQSVHQRTEAGT
jgi:hypothetical protein